MNRADYSVDHLAQSVSGLFGDALRALVGPSGDGIVIGSIRSADLGTASCFLLLALILHWAAALYLRRHQAAATPDSADMKRHTLGALRRPLFGLIWVCGIYFAVTTLVSGSNRGEALRWFDALIDRAFDLGVFWAVLWFLVRMTRGLESRMVRWASATESKLDDWLMLLLARSLRLIVPVLG